MIRRRIGIGVILRIRLGREATEFRGGGELEGEERRGGGGRELHNEAMNDGLSLCWRGC